MAADHDKVVWVASDDEFLRLRTIAFFLRTFPMRWGQMLWLIAGIGAFSYASMRLLALLLGGWSTDAIVFGFMLGTLLAALAVTALYRGVTHWHTMRWRVWCFRQKLRARRAPTTTFRSHHDPSRTIRWNQEHRNAAA